MTFRHVGTICLACIILAQLTGSAAEVDLTQLTGKGKPIAAAPLSFSGSSKDYIGVVREDTSKEGLPVRRIQFYPEGQTSPQFEFETMDGFVGFWPINGEWSGTLWSTGSAMTFRVFGPTSTGIGLLLEKGLQVPPELVDLDGDGQVELILTAGRFLVSNGRSVESPSSCSIYKWSPRDHRFNQVKTVPWSKRLESFRRLVK